MNALAARRANQRVVVQRRDDRHAVRPRQPRQVERQIEQVVNVDDIRLHGAHHMLDPVEHDRRPVRLFERRAPPVVHDLSDRQIRRSARQRHLAVRARWIVIGAEDRDVVIRFERAAQLERVDFRAGLMARQKIVDRVKDPHARFSPRAAA